MKKYIGKVIGLLLATLIMGAGLTGFLYMANLLAADGAHEAVRWLTLGGSTVTFAFGMLMITLWGDGWAKRAEARH